MRQSVLRHAAVAMLGICLVLSGGCARSRPSNFYVLQALKSPDKDDRAENAKHDVIVGVGPVDIPDYLDRPEIVTRSTPVRLTLAEFERWAEPLQKNLAQVLAENLSGLLSPHYVVSFPWPASIEVGYQVTVSVLQLEAVPDGKIVLGASWTIYAEESKRVLTMKQSKFTVPAASPDFEGIILAESQAVYALSREIAAAIELYAAEMPVGSGTKAPDTR